LFARDPDVRAKSTRLRGQQQLLNNLVMRPPTHMSADQVAAQRAAVRQQCDDLQAELNRLLAVRRGGNTNGEITLDAVLQTVDDVREKLPSGAALIEFVHYIPYRFSAAGKESQRGAPRYVAFVLKAESKQAVERVELGDAAEIDELVNAFTQQMENAKEAYQGNFRHTSEADLESSIRQTASRLYAQLFAPLEEALGNARRVFISPDGHLHNLPFEALVDGDGEDAKYLIDKGYQFSYLSSGRDLLRVEHNSGQGTYVFAGPNFDLEHSDHHMLVASLRSDSRETNQLNTPPDTAIAMVEPFRMRTTRSLELRGSTWQNLKGAEREGRDAVTQFDDSPFGPARYYHGNQALEEAFTQLSRPRLLVVITHGFFAADQPQSISDDALLGHADQTRGNFAAAVMMERLRTSENPLLRSGLVLAGANQADEPLPTGISDLADGWLTAEEISQLDLRGTDLVVLSACNSGRGKVATGEAVTGLRSAFMFAGARTLVGSLYEVPDDETRELMHDFYADICSGRGKLDSLNAAQKKMIARRRAAHGAAHPFFWASFVLVGQH
jgi:CHAT domain-containing protein